MGEPRAINMGEPRKKKTRRSAIPFWSVYCPYEQQHCSCHSFHRWEGIGLLERL